MSRADAVRGCGTTGVSSDLRGTRRATGPPRPGGGETGRRPEKRG